MGSFEEIIYMAIAAILTFLIGKFQEKPGYKKPKAVIDRLSKALEDRVLSPEEVKGIADVFEKEPDA